MPQNPGTCEGASVAVTGYLNGTILVNTHQASGFHGLNEMTVLHHCIQSEEKRERPTRQTRTTSVSSSHPFDRIMTGWLNLSCGISRMSNVCSSEIIDSFRGRYLITPRTSAPPLELSLLLGTMYFMPFVTLPGSPAPWGSAERTASSVLAVDTRIPGKTSGEGTSVGDVRCILTENTRDHGST